MEPKPRVSACIGGAYAHTRGVSVSSSTGSIPIRAPLTLDDDGSDFESNGHNTGSSDKAGSSYSSGFESGAEEDEEFFGGEDASEKCSRFGEKESASDGYDGPSLKSMRVMPRARLSMDDDEVDEFLSSEGEDDVFSGVAKVHSVPKIKVMTVEESEGEGSLDLEKSDYAGKPEIVGSFSGDSSGNESLVSHFEEREMMVSYGCDDGSVLNDNEGIGVIPEAYAVSRVRNEGGSEKEDLILGRDFEHYVEERPGLDNREEEIKKPSRMSRADASSDEVLSGAISGELIGDSGVLLHSEEEEIMGINNLNDAHQVNELVEKGSGVRPEACCLLDSNLGSDKAAEQPIEASPELREHGQETFKRNSSCRDTLEKNSAAVGDRSESAFQAIVKPVEEGFVGKHTEGLKAQEVNVERRDTTGNCENSECSAVSIDVDKLETNSELSLDLRGEVRMPTTSDDIEILANEVDHNGDQVEIIDDIELDLVQDYINVGSRGMPGEVNVIRSNIDSASDQEVISKAGNEAKHETEKMEERFLLEDVEDLNFKDSIEQTDEIMKMAAQESITLSLAEKKGFHDRAQQFDAVRGSAIETDGLSQDEKEQIEKLQLLRWKFLRLVERLGLHHDDPNVSKVLQKLALASGSLNTVNLSSPIFHKPNSIQLEAEGKDDLDLALNIVVLGKTGVGKSATINSIFGEMKASIGAFEPATSTVKEIFGIVNGVKFRVLDTPGLRSPASEEKANRSILRSIKKHMRKFHPDLILYVDRLDAHTQGDAQLLRLVTCTLGSSIWQKAILTLTNAASAPDGASYEMFVAHRYLILQQAISQAAGNLSTTLSVALVENNVLCGMSRAGESKIPDRESSRVQLLLLCYSFKILSEAYLKSKGREPSVKDLLFSLQVPLPLLTCLLTNLLQSQAGQKLSTGRGGITDFDSALNAEDFLESEFVYEHLPPFKPLKRAQLVKFDKEPGTQLLIRLVPDPHNWYHNFCDDSVSIERNLIMGTHILAAISIRTTEEKESGVDLDSLMAAKHVASGSTILGLEVQSTCRRNSYNFRAERKFKSFKGNKITAGLLFSLLDENAASGLKLEDQIDIGRLVVAACARAVNCQNNTTYGAKLEFQLKGKDFGLEGYGDSRFGLSLVRQSGCLSYMANLESRFSFGEGTKAVLHFGISKERNGYVNIRVGSSEELPITLIGVTTMVVSFIKSLCLV